MTVVLIHSSPTHIFMAADSARWDCVLKRNIGPVKKIHQAEREIIAIGGSGLNRSKLASLLVSLNPSDDMELWINRYGKRLIRQNVTIAEAQNKNVRHSAFVWRGLFNASPMRVLRQHVPSGAITTSPSIDLMGPDTAALETIADRTLAGLSKNKSLPLDQWAWDTILEAAEITPGVVSPPIDLIIARENTVSSLRLTSRPSSSAAFAIDLAE